MRKLATFLIVPLWIAVTGCSGGGSGDSGGGSTPIPQGQAACYGSIPGGSLGPASGSGSNVMNITIGTSTYCSNNPNVPCTSITLCAPGSTTNCQTITDILVDTGSYGLRVFSNAINSSLCSTFTPVLDSQSNPVGECQAFGIGADWGSVVKADVQLGGETPVSVPFQLINASFGWMPDACSQLQFDVNPASSGYNGILGVGLFTQDCQACATNANIGQYFACAGGTCYGAAVGLSNQVQNPVALLATDNQGVVFNLPTPGVGATSASGSVYLGIGTQANNTPGGGVLVYPANPSGQSGTFNTTFPASGGALYTESFIDSGSNALYFIPQGNTPDCPQESVANGFLCPNTTVALTANNQGFGVGTNGNVNFDVVNPLNYLETGNDVIPSLAADGSSIFTDSFDWGLPFFYGRKVWTAIQGAVTTTPTGTGPYWAY